MQCEENTGPAVNTHNPRPYLFNARAIHAGPHVYERCSEYLASQMDVSQLEGTLEIRLKKLEQRRGFISVQGYTNRFKGPLEQRSYERVPEIGKQR